MRLLTLIKKDEIHLPPKTKIVAAEEFSQLLTLEQLTSQLSEQETAYRKEVASECELLKQEAETAGFQQGQEAWTHQIALLEKEIKKVKQELEQAILPLALTAVRRILGKELELAPETIVDIVATALRTVTQHRRITIYVNKGDLESVEASRTRLKALFEHLESLSIIAREDVAQGGCIIETESGIINAQLENQLQALEATFRHFFQNRKAGKPDLKL